MQFVQVFQMNKVMCEYLICANKLVNLVKCIDVGGNSSESSLHVAGGIT